MDFSLDPQTVEVRDACRMFAEKEIAPHAARWSEEHHFPAEVFRKMGNLGLMGMLMRRSTAASTRDTSPT
jgi:short/branched chain acyl-CoA dehydrogenase